MAQVHRIVILLCLHVRHADLCFPASIFSVSLIRNEWVNVVVWRIATLTSPLSSVVLGLCRQRKMTARLITSQCRYRHHSNAKCRQFQSLTKIVGFRKLYTLVLDGTVQAFSFEDKASLTGIIWSTYPRRRTFAEGHHCNVTWTI